jgi:hypothetical protein
VSGFAGRCVVVVSRRAVTGQSGSGIRMWQRDYHPDRLVDGELGFDPAIQLKAISAASSFALLTFFPSYQNRAAKLCPWTVTLLDHAVRPPDRRATRKSCDSMRKAGACADSPRRSETIWKTGG